MSRDQGSKVRFQEPWLVRPPEADKPLEGSGHKNNKTPPLYLRNGVFISIARPLSLLKV